MTTRLAAIHTVTALFSGCGGLDLGVGGRFDALCRRFKRLPFEIV